MSVYASLSGMLSKWPSFKSKIKANAFYINDISSLLGFYLWRFNAVNIRKKYNHINLKDSLDVNLLSFPAYVRGL